MAKDIWELATKIRQEAERFELAICDTNGDIDGIEENIKGHIEELESYIEEIRNEIEIN